MKKLLFSVAIAALVLGVSSASFAANHYGITNEDNPSGNTATAWEFSGGSIHAAKVLTATGQFGEGGGYFAAPRNAVEQNASCIFVANTYGDDGATNYGSISAFSKATNFALVGSYNDGFTFAGYDDGMGLALNPAGTVLVAAYSGTSNFGVWTVNSDCSLTLGSVVADPAGDFVSPITVTSDGARVVTADPNDGNINVWSLSGTTMTLLTSNSLSSVVTGGTPCSSTGCYPTGLDTACSGGSCAFIVGNATLSGPYYITGTINETTGVLSNASNTAASTSIANIESPVFSHAAYTTGTGTVYLGASGFGSGYPVGVQSASISSYGPSITLGTVFVNSAGYYGGGISVTTVNANEAGIWQTIYTSTGTNNVYLYKATGTGGGTVAALANTANTSYPGGITLSISAFPGR